MEKRAITISIIVVIFLFLILFFTQPSITGLATSILKSQSDTSVDLAKPIFTGFSNFFIILILFFLIIVFAIARIKKENL